MFRISLRMISVILLASFLISGGLIAAQDTTPEPTPADPVPSDPSLISYNAFVQHDLQTPVGDIWTFEGEAGDVVEIRMTGAFDAYLELLDPQNDQIAYDDDSGGDTSAWIQAAVLPEKGTYSIIARSFDSSDRGTYELYLGEVEIVAPGELAIGEIASTILVNPRGDVWTFEGTENDTITAILLADFSLVELQLYGPGNRLYLTVESSYGDPASIEEYVLPQTGTYSIAVYSRYGYTGRYSLILGRPWSPS